MINLSLKTKLQLEYLVRQSESKVTAEEIISSLVQDRCVQILNGMVAEYENLTLDLCTAQRLIGLIQLQEGMDEEL